MDEMNECFHLWFGPRQVMKAMHIVCSAEVSKPGQQGAVEAAMRDSRGSWRKQREGNVFGVESNFLSGIQLIK